MRKISSLLSKFILSASVCMVSATCGAQIIFQDDFDSQPDWNSGLAENNTGAFPVNGAGPDRIQRTGTHKIPLGWSSVYQEPKWAPSTGYPDRHEVIEILTSNSDKARGGAGKSFVERRDSSLDPLYKWNSDGQLMKIFDAGYDQLYIEFYIRFGSDWTLTPSEDTSKIFRVGSWSGQGSEFQAFSGGEQGPLFLWDWKQDKYGIRNVQTLRGGPYGENYTMTDAQKGSHPRGSLNFTTDTVGMGFNGSTPKIPDRVNGGYISDNLTQLVSHQQVYGNLGEWTKVAFFVKMNSAPGVNDGWLVQWLNDVQILNVRDISWISPSATDPQKMVKWNFFSIGGNDYFKSYPDAERRQEWYAIDDVLIRDDMPDYLKSGVALPEPPSGIKIQ